MFIQNKFHKWYFSIIDKAIVRQSGDEKHHIVPKSFGGSDDKSNLVLLTFREHYVCHLLLTKMCEGELKHKMLYAIHRMVFSEKYGNGSRLYERFRSEFIESLKEFHYTKTIEPGIMSERTKQSWAGDEKRKAITSELMSKAMADRWKDEKLRPHLLEQARINSKKGNRFGRDNYMCKDLELEFYGSIFYGWKELKDATGVSKGLYNRYYTKGIDPRPRIGANGPLNGTKRGPNKMKIIPAIL